MTSVNPDETLYFNGINGATGGYFFPPQTVAEISEIAQTSMIAKKVDGRSLSDVTSDPHLCDLINRHRNDNEDKFDVIEGVDPNDLSDTGWGIIFPVNVNPAIREALSELIEHRKQEAGDYFKEYEFFPGESANDFLSQRGAKVFDPADPSKVPYYLLIVGDFHEIPFDFQYQLDVQYAVGRIYFKTPQEYAQYAHSVVQAEKTNLSLPCQANLFGVRTPGDKATELSADNLIQPLQEFLTSDKRFQKKNAHWKFDTHLEEAATKAQLSQLLGGKETPAFLFTASHGIGFPNDDPRQLPHQGALICQDWPGPKSGEPTPEDHYFSADDIGDDARLWGLISFHFACFGAGTPKMDEFGHKENDWQQIAPYSFMANLPQRLLSHPKGGALAFVGHVARAWGYSFGGKKEQLTTFKSTLQRLIEGNRVGRAVECFNERYAAVSSELTTNLWYIKAGKKSEDSHLSTLWTTNNDARGYAILGDPAVRLMVGNNVTQVEKRPEIKSVEFFPSQSNVSNPLEVTSDSTLPQQNTTEEALSELLRLLNNLPQRVEQLKQQSLTEKDLSELKILLSNFDNKVKELE
jgi:hypothetical protein